VSLGLALVVVAAAAVLAAVTMLLLRRRAPAGGVFSDPDRAAGVFSVLGTGFAIFLGFVIFLAFTDFDRTKQDAEAEAESTLQQFEDARLFSQADRTVLEGELICYGRSVVEQEWPRMERGAGASPLVELWSLRLERSSETVAIAGIKANAGFQSLLRQTEQRAHARNGRLLEARHPLPPMLWALIVIAAALVVGFVLMYADPADPAIAQAAIAGSVAAMAVAGVLLVGFLDSPFGGGSGAIAPVQMRHSLKLMEAEFHGAPPCAPNGAPTRA
jgi:hypothetical protein